MLKVFYLQKPLSLIATIIVVSIVLPCFARVASFDEECSAYVARQVGSSLVDQSLCHGIVSIDARQGLYDWKAFGACADVFIGTVALSDVSGDGAKQRESRGYEALVEAFEACRFLGYVSLLREAPIGREAPYTCAKDLVVAGKYLPKEAIASCVLGNSSAFPRPERSLFDVIAALKPRSFLGAYQRKTCLFCRSDLSNDASVATRVSLIHYDQLKQFHRRGKRAMAFGPWILGNPADAKPLAKTTTWLKRVKALGIDDFRAVESRSPKEILKLPLYWQLRRMIFELGYEAAFFFIDRDLDKRFWTRLELELLLSEGFTGELYLVVGTPDLDKKP